MSSPSSLPCVVEKCELASLALCQCCRQNLCIDHLNEHASQRNDKLLPFIDKINCLLNRFSTFYDGEHSGLKQLDEWKQAAYKIVDDFYEKKRREIIDATADTEREQLKEMNNKLKELLRIKGGTKQDFDTFSENMRSIEQHLDKLQQIQINLPTFTINDNSISQASPQKDNSIEKIVNKSNKSPEHTKQKSEKLSDKKKSSDKSSKKKKRSSRHSDDSSDRSSRHKSRSPHDRPESLKKKRDKSPKSSSPQSSNGAKKSCKDCNDCRFYQDRFGPGFMDSFGPCKCDCHTWAYTQ
ncbi:unnamed protein product [Rotaria magnacalcarata]|uniref:Uncharacterized protein n=1 Tax=Rotaria magnacalcarata TaxID=392030 RepID=A0A818XEK6_9BILA|nr:unnamed protein product [Rotaria magnacalcarata]CAF3828671.1 unnamed protein product [Rotaria magnacalcarata]CAF3980277.1 unnamed protein product [Rotaria magnacalcarata]CAF3989656.1 unnamed protein product [Rotaria magnacalcarata]CAF4020788.1 unnamed protein product [Rotaria magnacalcarata]